MEQINNGFADCYYLTEEGIIYNSSTKSYLKPDKSHKFKLKRTDNTYKSIALKSLYKLVYHKNFCIDNIESLDNEEWKEIIDTDSTYFVSSKGRIKSYNGYEAILLKPFANQRGYLRVDIIQSGQRQTKLVHRIVAAYFLPVPKNIEYQLHHKNGQKTCNVATNLEWLSPAKHREAHKLLNEKRRNTTNVSTESKENNH